MFSRLRGQQAIRHAPAAGNLLLVAGVLLAYAGCGTDPLVEPPPDPKPDTLPSTVTDPPVYDDTVSPASTDDTPAVSQLDFAATTIFCCNPLSIDFVAELTLSGELASTDAVLVWDFGDSYSSDGQQVRHTYGYGGEFAVTLTAYLSNGETLTVTHVLSLGAGVAGGTDLVTDDGELADDVPTDGSLSTLVVANAGADQTVTPGELVSLDASLSSYPQSPPPSFQWQELSGYGVELSDATSISPTFVAPGSSDQPATLVFLLTVRSDGVEATDSVLVSIEPPDVVPESDASYDPVIEFLSGPSGEASPGMADVSWRFLNPRNVSEVYLRADSCRKNDIDGEILTPNTSGIYETTFEIPAGKTSWYFVRYKRLGVQYNSRSVFVNTQHGYEPTEPAQVIWFHLYNQSRTVLADAIRSGIITHVMINGGDRVTVGLDNSNVIESINMCRDAGVEIIWSRHLWNQPYELQYIEDTWDPQTYEDAILQVRTEAELLGVDATAIDCEPYGNSPLVEYLKGGPLPSDNHAAMMAAMEAAVVEAGQVDYVYPVRAVYGPEDYSVLNGLLGVRRIPTSTYYDVPSKNCRIDYPLEFFSAFIQTTTERVNNGEWPYFLPHDVVLRRYLWSAADGALDNINGLFLYPGEGPGAASTARMLADFFSPE